MGLGGYVLAKPANLFQSFAFFATPLISHSYLFREKAGKLYFQGLLYVLYTKTTEYKEDNPKIWESEKLFANGFSGICCCSVAPLALSTVAEFLVILCTCI
jgi:hypothetical protein